MPHHSFCAPGTKHNPHPHRTHPLQERADEQARRAQLEGVEGTSIEIRGWYAQAIVTIKEYVANKFEMFVGSLAVSAPVDVQVQVL